MLLVFGQTPLPSTSRQSIMAGPLSIKKMVTRTFRRFTRILESLSEDHTNVAEPFSKNF